ncbi:MAG: hypothetical protein ACLU9S_15175 [Oscillospiraceae bacterium]
MIVASLQAAVGVSACHRHREPPEQRGLGGQYGRMRSYDMNIGYATSRCSG